MARSAERLVGFLSLAAALVISAGCGGGVEPRAAPSPQPGRADTVRSSECDSSPDIASVCSELTALAPTTIEWVQGERLGPARVGLDPSGDVRYEVAFIVNDSIASIIDRYDFIFHPPESLREIDWAQASLRPIESGRVLRYTGTRASTRYIAMIELVSEKGGGDRTTIDATLAAAL